MVSVLMDTDFRQHLAVEEDGTGKRLQITDSYREKE